MGGVTVFVELARTCLSPITLATTEPRTRVPITLSTIRLPPIKGINTIDAMMRAGRFMVDEPWVIATVVSMPAPRRRNAVAIGTMHAEQSDITGPITAPFKTPLNPCPVNRWLLFFGKRNDSVIPAIMKANTIPIHTKLRYVSEKFHHRSPKVELSVFSKQKPWKHCATGEVTIARSASTVSSLGIRLNARKRPRRTVAEIIPTSRRFLRSVSNSSAERIEKTCGTIDSINCWD